MLQDVEISTQLDSELRYQKQISTIKSWPEFKLFEDCCELKPVFVKQTDGVYRRVFLMKGKICAGKYLRFRYDNRVKAYLKVFLNLYLKIHALAKELDNRDGEGLPIYHIGITSKMKL